MIISQTPFRVSLFGGGTDFPEWFEHESGAVVSGAINKFAYLSLRELPPFFDHRIRAVYSRIEAVASAEHLTHPAVREILGHYLPGEGLEVVYQGDLPAQSGVGTSSAFTVGLLAAVKALKGHVPTREELAREAIWVEQELLAEKVGVQDQIASAYGGLNLITFGPGKQDFSVQSIPNSDSLAKTLESCLVLIFSGKQRLSSEVQKDLDPGKARTRANLHRTYELVHDFLELSLNHTNHETFAHELGELLNESWELKKAINPGAVTDGLETMKQSLQKQGATGAKILGAGGGGFVLAAISPDKRNALIDWANKQQVGYALEFSFSDRGSQIIHNSPDSSNH